MVLIVDLILILALLYIIGGLLFSIFFYSKGAALLDEGTIGTPWHFKAIIFPGVVLFWSILMIKIFRSK